MRGYFAIGVERISKALNIGNLFRSAHAFGASFVFTINAQYDRKAGTLADTSDSLKHLPFYNFPGIESMSLPNECSVVGIELTNHAIELPSFRHPARAAYVLGPERGFLSTKLLSRCDHIIKIPTKFCVNVGIAGAIVMYDRLNSLGQFPERPLRPGGPRLNLSNHKYWEPKFRSQAEEFRAKPTTIELDIEIDKSS